MARKSNSRTNVVHSALDATNTVLGVIAQSIENEQKTNQETETMQVNAQVNEAEQTPTETPEGWDSISGGNENDTVVEPETTETPTEPTIDNSDIDAVVAEAESLVQDEPQTDEEEDLAPLAPSASRSNTPKYDLKSAYAKALELGIVREMNTSQRIRHCNAKGMKTGEISAFLTALHGKLVRYQHVRNVLLQQPKRADTLTPFAPSKVDVAIHVAEQAEEQNAA
jgi:hypothetical protein